MHTVCYTKKENLCDMQNKYPKVEITHKLYWL